MSRGTEHNSPSSAFADNAQQFGTFQAWKDALDSAFENNGCDFAASVSASFTDTVYA
jgi:hypothetical protein